MRQCGAVLIRHRATGGGCHDLQDIPLLRHGADTLMLRAVFPAVPDYAAGRDRLFLLLRVQGSFLMQRQRAVHVTGFHQFP